MGIREIKLGPKSKLAEPAADAQQREDFVEAVMSATMGTGCACGRYLLKSPTETYEVRGTVHRANLPCHVKGESKQEGVPPSGLGTLNDLERRMVAVEKVMADLVRRLKPDPGPRCVCGDSWAEHEGHIGNDWKQEARACTACSCTLFQKAGTL